ncbi:hypothetical protein [Flexivirga alba]|uniref:Uncharacterized protein n=1 Tax=Flexivirga alba TaxID=702742 RepID=A0ABW2AAX9_9MICO
MTVEQQVRGPGVSTPVRVHAVLRLLMAMLITFTVVVQLVEVLTRAEPGKAGNFFSYFTIESNIIVAVVFAVAAVIQLRGQGSRAGSTACGVPQRSTSRSPASSTPCC